MKKKKWKVLELEYEKEINGRQTKKIYKLPSFQMNTTTTTTTTKMEAIIAQMKPLI